MWKTYSTLRLRFEWTERLDILPIRPSIKIIQFQVELSLRLVLKPGSRI